MGQTARGQTALGQMALALAALGLAAAFGLAGCAPAGTPLPGGRLAAPQAGAGLPRPTALGSAPQGHGPQPAAPQQGAPQNPSPGAKAAGLSTSPAPTGLSALLRLRYQRSQDLLLAQGQLRRDGQAPADAPFTDRMLAENFLAIALHDEYVAERGRFVPRQVPSRLRRWQDPVVLGVEFGASVPADQRQSDLASLAGLTQDLASASRHPIRLGSVDKANFHLLILTEDERRASGPRLAELVPGIDALSLQTVLAMDPSTYCLVLAFSDGDSPVYRRAVAVVRAEHPTLMRQACFHEEIAQGLGLANDSPAARPSVFNDNEEFALLTQHDRLLLRMLYDPRLRPGMSLDQARPLVLAIATELIEGQPRTTTAASAP